jgi:hypothetical protein
LFLRRPTTVRADPGKIFRRQISQTYSLLKPALEPVNNTVEQSGILLVAFAFQLTGHGRRGEAIEPKRLVSRPLRPARTYQLCFAMAAST